MTRQTHVEVTDHQAARLLGQFIKVGHAFAFVDHRAAEQKGLSKKDAAKLAARRKDPIIPLFGDETVELPGVRLRPVDLPQLRLASITSDKQIYREGCDTVHLFALDIDASAGDRPLEVHSGGAVFARRNVRLDDCGCGALALGELPAGEYEVRWQQAPADEPSCQFTVAEYRLAPLVATLVSRSLEGTPQRLKMQLRLETFGLPVHGPVRLELLDGDRRIAESRVEARQGSVECAFELTGEGPHSVNVQMEGDASRTATVPIIGSRKAERSLTLFSRLGRVVAGSLLPGEDSRLVRGIYLSEEGVETTPFRLERVDQATARVRTMTSVESVCILVLQPGGRVQPGDGGDKRKVVRKIVRGPLPAGETIAVPTPGPLALLAIGAVVERRSLGGMGGNTASGLIQTAN